MLIPRFFRSFLYASSFFFEVFTITLSEPFANAFLPTLPAFSFSDLMIIFFRFSHPSKAFFPMDLICFPIVISLMVVLSLKALSSMEVTRYFTPATVTLFGIIILLFFDFLEILYATVGLSFSLHHTAYIFHLSQSHVPLPDHPSRRQHDTWYMSL